MLFTKLLNENDKTIVISKDDEWFFAKANNICKQNSIKVIDVGSNMPDVNYTNATGVLIKDKNILFNLEQRGVPCINSLNAINICETVPYLFSTLKYHSIQIPEYKLVYNPYILDFNTPVTIRKNGLSECVVYEHIDGAKVSVCILNNKYMGSYNDSGDSCSILEAIISECLRASSVLKLFFSVFEVIITNKEFYITNVIPYPEIFYLEQYLKTDITTELLTQIVNVSEKKVCGHTEAITIKNVGTVVAKFDTGSAINILHAEDIEISKDEGTVIWQSYGTSLKKKYKKLIVLKNDVSLPVVEMDVEFNGKLFKNVEFSLGNRSGNTTPIVLSKEFISSMNILIDPSREFLQSVNPFVFQKQ